MEVIFFKKKLYIFTTFLVLLLYRVIIFILFLNPRG